MKITIIDFIRHNPWGSTDWATHYYANGKRISKNTYYRCYSSMNGYKHDYTEEKTIVKDGITRNYTIIHYKEKVV